jgi:hypothetical protein
MASPRWSREIRFTVALLCFGIFVLLLVLALPLVEALAAAALLCAASIGDALSPSWWCT